MDRDQWLRERRQGLCSTDAAAVAGLSPWRTALDIYLDKRGLLPAVEPSPEMRWGLLLEPTLAQEYEVQTGRELVPPPPLVRSDTYPWMLSSLDRLTGDGTRIVELKTARTGEGWGTPGTDEIPEPYLLQVQHQLAVTGLAVADLAVLIGGSDYRIYTVARHDGLLQNLVCIEGDFWDQLQAGIPPEPDWQHPRTPELLTALYGVEEGPAVELGEQEAELAHLYEDLGEEIRQLERNRAVARSKLLYAMGEAGRAVLPDGTRLIRKRVKRAQYVVRPSEYVQFRVQTRRAK